MKFKLIIVALLMTLSSIVMAGTSNEQTQNILVKTKPNAVAKTMMQVKPGQRLIIFYNNKKGWLKAGDPKTGQVGWVNKQQYRQAMRQRMSANKLKIRSSMLEVEQNKGKPVKIIAYKDGKKLSPAASKKRYQQMRRKNQAKHKTLRLQMKQMREQMQQMHKEMKQTFNPATFAPPVVIVKETDPRAQPIGKANSQ
jgi:hypothetical protein